MRISFVLPAFILFAAPAFALSLSVTNLDYRTHHLSIRPNGGGEYTLDVPPSRKMFINDHDATIANLDDPEGRNAKYTPIMP